MSNYLFENSIHLFKTLRELKLPSGQSLYNELKCGSQVSLWDIVAPYLVLYRFPLLWDEEHRHSLKQRQLLRLWPYRGLAAQLKDTITKRPRFNNDTSDRLSPDGTTVLFLGFHNMFYREVLQSVAEWLTKNTELRVVILGQQSPIKESDVTINSQTFQSIWGYWDRTVAKRTKEMLTQLKVFQKSILNQIKFTEMIRRANIDVDVLTLHREFKSFFWRECRRLIPQIAIAEHILIEQRPAIIVSADDADQRCRIYSLLGQKLGIPSLLVQQGLTLRNYPEWSMFSMTAIAAMGESSRSDMVAQGIFSDRITITGHPGFDRLVMPEQDACGCIRRELEVKDGQSMILFASQPYYVGTFMTAEIRNNMIRAIVQSAANVPNVRLVIKAHPSEDVRELRRIVGRNAPCVLFAERDTDISILVKACDVLITFYSTVGLQALYAGKPVINVTFPGSFGSTLYQDSGATFIAHSLAEIIMHLKNLTGVNQKNEISKLEDARQKFISKLVYYPDGRGAERVGHLIIKCMNKRSDISSPLREPLLTGELMRK